ncbi:MAG: hypothetical protein ACPH54_06220 [Candidatus Poseidoniaceae archaeon]
MDGMIGSALLVTISTSPSERNAINVANQKQEAGVVKDNLVEDFQIAVNEADVILIDVEGIVMVAEVSVEIVEDVIPIAEADEILIAAEEVGMEVETSVGTEADVIQIDVEEAEMVVEPLVETEVTETNHEILDGVVTMNVQTNAIEKRVESAQVMLTIEDLNPFVLDAIKAKIETIEVNPRDGRSTLLGCSGSTRIR